MPSYQRVAQLYQVMTSSRQAIPLTQLCESLDTSPATIKRLISFLRHDLQMNIVFDSEHGGYRIATDERSTRHAIGPLHNSKEISDLFTTCLIAEKLVPNLFNCTGESIRNQLRQSLGAKAKKLNDLSDRVCVIAPQKRTVSPQDFADLVVALRDQIRITIYYRELGGSGGASHTVSPYRLILYRNNWHLAGWCHQDHTLKVLAAERIKVTDMTATPCRPIHHDELSKAVEAAYGIDLGKPSDHAVLRFSPKAAKRVALEEWHRDQTQRHHADGSLELTVPYRQTRELKMDVLRFGSEVEVVAPLQLRQEVAQDHAKAAQQYAADLVPA